MLVSNYKPINEGHQLCIKIRLWLMIIIENETAHKNMIQIQQNTLILITKHYEHNHAFLKYICIYTNIGMCVYNYILLLDIFFNNKFSSCFIFNLLIRYWCIKFICNDILF